MATDVDDLAKEMIGEAAGILGNHWKKARAFAEPELKKIALSVASLELSLARGEITPDEARALLAIQRNASRAVLTATEVIGIVAAERAINAALAIVAEPIRRAIGIVV